MLYHMHELSQYQNYFFLSLFFGCESVTQVIRILYLYVIELNIHLENLDVLNIRSWNPTN